MIDQTRPDDPDRPPPAVSVHDLVKAYAGHPVVDRLSFTAAAGAVTAVLGPNGAGKTTAIECCEGLRRPDTGRVRVLGQDPATAGPALRAAVGVMLQTSGLPQAARAGELLHHLAALHAAPLAPDALLDELGLAPHRRTTVRRLSGGQRQRLALAIAVIGRPRVLFLDEPGAGLDPQARLAVWQLVRRLRAEGAGIVLTTHQMEEAERLADHVVVLDDGHVIAEGSPTALTGDDTELAFTLDTRIDPSALTAALLGQVTVRQDDAGRCTLRSTHPGPFPARTVATAVTWCADRDLYPTGLALTRRTLEDVFLDLTGRSLR